MIVRVCEEEESNVIVMGSRLVESMGEGAQTNLEDGCAMNGYRASLCRGM